jgi:hypothetical protein
MAYSNFSDSCIDVIGTIITVGVAICVIVKFWEMTSRIKKLTSDLEVLRKHTENNQRKISK